MHERLYKRDGRSGLWIPEGAGRRPFGQVEPIPNHPLAPNLLAIFADQRGGPAVRNGVQTLQYTPARVGSPTWDVSGMDFPNTAGATASHYLNYTNLTSLNVTGPFVLVAIFRSDSLPASTPCNFFGKGRTQGGSSSSSGPFFYTYGSDVRIATWQSASLRYVGTTISANTRYVVVGAYDGVYLRLFVNGVQATPYAMTGTHAGSGNAFTVGCAEAAGNFADAFDGTLEYGAYYNAKLTEAQLYELARDPFVGFRPRTRSIRFPYMLVQASWTGIVFGNKTPPSGSQAADGTPIKCDVTDNWYTFENADITITVAGEQYTSADPEVSYETITNGKRIIWTPPPGYQYGRGTTVAVRVDAKNSHNDESYTEWSFVGKYYASAMEAETSFFFHSPAEAAAELLTIFRQASEEAAELCYLFRHASGGREDAVAQLLFGIRDRWIGTGECEPTVFVCELKRTFGQGGANVAEVEVLAGEASADVYGQYLIIAGGDANIQAFQIFAVPTGSGDIQVTLVWEGQGDANIGIPVRIGGEGSAQIFKVEGTTFIRINALPAAIRQALQDAGIIINP